jgi:diguanylate cyclase (GGDEF)-like protein
VAKRLKACVRAVDTVARFGGDEFVVLLSELNANKAESTTQAGIVAEKIRTSLSEPYLLAVPQSRGKVDNVVEHHCSASIGVVIFVNDDASQDAILKWADAAMYQAKEAGRNLIQFFEQK